MTETTDALGISLLACGAGDDPIEDRLRGCVRATIEAVFEGELATFLGRLRYDRSDGGDGARKGYRHGHRERQLTGSFGAEKVRVPRARIADEAGKVKEWRSQALPRYQRLTKKAEAKLFSQAQLVAPLGHDAPEAVRVLHRLATLSDDQVLLRAGDLFKQLRHARCDRDRRVVRAATLLRAQEDTRGAVGPLLHLPPGQGGEIAMP